VTCKKDKKMILPNPIACGANDSCANAMCHQYKYGHYQTMMSSRADGKGHPHCGKDVKSHHIVATHDLFLINEKDTYTKHRCYTYDDECICECVDAPTYVTKKVVGLTGKATSNKATILEGARHQEGTIQGNAIGIDLRNHVKKVRGQYVRHWNGQGVLMPLHPKDHEMEKYGQMAHQNVFMAKDRFWKPPSYYVSQEEVDAVKKCCTKFTSLAWINIERKCDTVATATTAQIKEWLAEMSPTVTNVRVQAWLTANSCEAPKYGTYSQKSFPAIGGYDAIANGPDYNVNDQHHEITTDQVGGHEKRASFKSTIQFSDEA